jgi:hypothetical protein
MDIPKMNLSLSDRLLISAACSAILGITLYLIFTKLDAKECCKPKYATNQMHTAAQMHTTSTPPKIIKQIMVEPHYDPYQGEQRYGSYSKEEFDDTTEGFQEGFGLSDIGDFFNKIGDFFNKIGRFFKALEQLGPRFQRLGNFFPDLGKALQAEFNNLGTSLKTGFDDIFKVIEEAFKYTVNVLSVSFNCFIKFIQNFQFCSVFYFLDLLYYILYGMFYQFPLFLLKQITGVDMSGIVNDIWNQVVIPLDDLIHDLTKGYHFIHWPDFVFDRCYACDVMSAAGDTDKLFRAIDNINDDWKYQIPIWLNQPRQMFIEAGEDVTQMFAPLDF